MVFGFLYFFYLMSSRLAFFFLKQIKLCEFYLKYEFVLKRDFYSNFSSVTETFMLLNSTSLKILPNNAILKWITLKSSFMYSFANLDLNYIKITNQQIATKLLGTDFSTFFTSELHLHNHF